MSPLPASAFRPGDLVIGTDEGGTYRGIVSEHQAERHAQQGEVLIYWAQERYVSSSQGHLCPADMLRLWPSRAHERRLAEAARLADHPVTPDEAP